MAHSASSKPPSWLVTHPLWPPPLNQALFIFAILIPNGWGQAFLWRRNRGSNDSPAITVQASLTRHAYCRHGNNFRLWTRSCCSQAAANPTRLLSDLERRHRWAGRANPPKLRPLMSSSRWPNRATSREKCLETEGIIRPTETARLLQSAPGMPPATHLIKRKKPPFCRLLLPFGV